ncbi:hypothetical protein [Limnobacter sp.]|uniref:hypothetical protein n=1 Tax=Limnobacter sp. TaxID=2003368 RepID=UPI002733A18D|nr:hypothetical protein [Limnobacter sp.]MDP3187555.1 hypothetical protein [Limnobacter sp.]
MSSKFTVIYDACVLYPAPLRDLLMNTHVRDSLVTGFEYLIPVVELPDVDDRHVVAAAIHGDASLIVTFNLKDFPPERLKPYNLVAQHPDDFIFDLLDLHAARVCEAASSHRRSLPKYQFDKVIATCSRVQ